MSDARYFEIGMANSWSQYRGRCVLPTRARTRRITSARSESSEHACSAMGSGRVRSIVTATCHLSLLVLGRGWDATRLLQRYRISVQARSLAKNRTRFVEP